MSNYKKIIRFLSPLILILGLYNIKIVFATIGSDLTTIQSYTQLLAANNATNEIGSGTLMDNGFFLTDNTTTCTNNSVFPVRGLINFNRGKFYLNRNMPCAQGTYFGTGGEIDGCGYAINLPKTPTLLNIPDPNAITSLTGSVSSQTTAGSANSVSFSYNDKYVAAGLAAGASNLSVYGFSKGTLSAALTTISVGANNVQTVSWNPTNYYLAVGTNAGTNGLYIYRWTPSTNTLTNTSQPSITGAISAVAWSYDGAYLAVSYATGASSAVQIYSCSNAGALTAVGSAYVYGVAGDTTPNNCLSWNFNGSLLTLGKNNGTSSTLYVLVFNGSTLTLGSSTSLGATTSVSCVAFRPINSNSLNVTTNQISTAQSDSNSDGKNLLFSYYAGGFTALYASANETLPFYSTAWSSDGMLCAFGGNSGTGNLRVYFAPENNFWYVSTNTYLILSSPSLNIGTNLLSIDFANTTNNYIAAGGGASVMVYSLYQLSPYRTTCSFNKTSLTLNSDLQLNTTVTFNGNCTINGNSNKLILGSSANLKVAAGSTLSLQDIEIVGLNKTNLQCLDNSASIMIENSKLTLTSNFVFDTGSMLFNMGVIISGTNKFSYTSKMTSTINPYSFLYLDKNLTFSYAPVVPYRNLIYMPDNSAWLYLDGCTLHSSRTGLLLTSGQLFIDNNASLQSEGKARSQSIQFGNGTAKYDLTINLLAATQLNISGRVEYANSF